MLPDFRVSSFILVGVHSILTASFKSVGYFLMYLISVPQGSVCLYAHNVSVCGSRLENSAFSNKNQSRVQIQSFTALSKKLMFLFHQMILLPTIAKKLFNSSHIHGFYVFSS